MSRIVIHVYAAPTEKIYLSKVPYTDEKKVILDSAIIHEEQDSIIFYVPLEPDRLYELDIKSSNQKFTFIPDASGIMIHANNISGRYTATGSPATNSLKEFYNRQENILQHTRKIKLKIDSLNNTGHVNQRLTDSLGKWISDSITLIQTLKRKFVDTVMNPAAFLAIYSISDFGDDRELLKKIVIDAHQRFPHSKPVDDLKREVFEMASIFEQEFNIGDTLPAISVPDLSGNLVSTNSFRGKFYLIDFWATWCPRCLDYNPFKAELFSKTNPASFQLVSVALDDNRDDWKAMITRNHYDWIQLLDEKMWRGTAARTLKFDSIPFNFLVSPNGIVLAKAIRPDSLITTVRRFIR